MSIDDRAPQWPSLANPIALNENGQSPFSKRHYDDEMADVYKVVPMERGPHDPESAWTVTCNGEPVRHFSPDKRHPAEWYGIDPSYRKSLEVRKAYEQQPTAPSRPARPKE